MTHLHRLVRATDAGRDFAFSTSMVGESGNNLTYRFCPTCGSTIAYKIDAWPDVVAVPLGAFARHEFPDPTYSIYESRKQSWVTVSGSATIHHD